MKQGDQTITTDVTFSNNVNVLKNIVISGLVNGIDLSSFNKKSPELNSELDDLERQLNETLAKQCESLTFVKEALAG